MKNEKQVPDWNKDGVWENVKGKLHQKKKRRFLYWWLGSATSVVLFFGLLFLFNDEIFVSALQNHESTAESEKEISFLGSQNVIPIDAIVDLEKKTIQDPRIKDVQKKSGNGNTLNGAQGNIKSTSPTSQSKLIASSNTLLNKPITSNVNSISPNRTSEIESNFYDQTSQSNLNSIPSSILGSTVSSEEIPSLDTARVDGVVINSNSDQKLLLLDALPILSLDLFEHKSRWPELKLSAITGFKLSLNPIKNSPSVLVWAESGLSFGDKLFNNLAIESNITGQFRFMQTNSVGVQRFLNKNWSIKLGLGYQTIYEKYEYLASTTIEEQVFSEEGIVYSLLDGTEYTEPGMATLRTTIGRDIVHNNFIHRLSLPLEVTYLIKRNRWSVEPSLGFRFQVFEKFDGIIVGEDGYNFDVSKINEIYYAEDISVGLVASVKLQYMVFNTSSLGVRFVYEEDDVFGLNKSELVTKYRTMGLHLGFYHSF